MYLNFSGGCYACYFNVDMGDRRGIITCPNNWQTLISVSTCSRMAIKCYVVSWVLGCVLLCALVDMFTLRYGVFFECIGKFLC